jgi:hypothetical protein
LYQLLCTILPRFSYLNTACSQSTDLFSDADTLRAWWRSMAGWFINDLHAGVCGLAEELLRHTAHWMQERHTSKTEKCAIGNVLTTMPAVNLNVQNVVECSCNILELNRSIKSKWAILGLCRYCIQWATYACTDWRTQKHRRDAAIFQLDRHQALANVILLNVYCTTTADPFKRLPFLIPNKIQRIKSPELLTSLNQYTASDCSTQNRPQKQAMPY